MYKTIALRPMRPSKTVDAARHPIGVVTARTGLSTDVLRAWERRYALVRPSRAGDGSRLYSDADVERLTLVHNAAGAGRSVAALASLSTEELRRMVAEDAERASTRPGRSGPYREQAMAAVRELAPERLESLLRRALLSLGAVPFLQEVVGPLLVDIGDAWHEGRIEVAQEHAASATLVQTLGGLARALELPGDAPRVVLATPRGEPHALGAMIAAAAAAHDGWHVTWLGSDLPAAQIAAGAEQGDARLVALSVATDSADVDPELRALRTLLPRHVPLLVGGAGASRLSNARGLIRVRDLDHWRALLRTHAGQSRHEA